MAGVKARAGLGSCKGVACRLIVQKKITKSGGKVLKKIARNMMF